MMNHEWTRMDTKFDQTTDYTDSLAAGPIAAEGGAYGLWLMAYG